MRRHDAGGFVMTIIASSAFATACTRRLPSALDAMRDELAGSVAPPAGFAVGASVSAKRITQRELDSVKATSLADAIERLRPTWLRERGTDPLLGDGTLSVYVNDTYAGGPDELRLIPLERVAAVQLLSRSAGFDRFGHTCRCDGGVILVITGRR